MIYPTEWLESAVESLGKPPNDTMQLFHLSRMGIESRTWELNQGCQWSKTSVSPTMSLFPPMTVRNVRLTYIMFATNSFYMSLTLQPLSIALLHSLSISLLILLPLLKWPLYFVISLMSMLHHSIVHK